MDLLPSYYSSHRANSPIAMTTMALALECAANEPSNSHFAALGKLEYGQDLSAVQVAINNPDQWVFRFAIGGHLGPRHLRGV